MQVYKTFSGTNYMCVCGKVFFTQKNMASGVFRSSMTPADMVKKIEYGFLTFSHVVDGHVFAMMMKPISEINRKIC